MVRELSDGKPTPDMTPLHLGRPVEGSDGRLGRLTDVVVERNERRLTHLVVEDSEGKARLVPAERLVDERESDGSVVLSCSSADLAACDSIRSFSYVGFGAAEPEGKSEGTDVGVEDVVAMPAFGALAFADYAGEMGGAYGMTYDSIPAGSAELRRDSIVVTGRPGDARERRRPVARGNTAHACPPASGRPWALPPAPDSGLLGRCDRH